jgi:hypothetical protein
MSLDFQANYPQPWVCLGSVKLLTTAATSSVLTFAAYDELTVQILITAYGGSDVASLRFNGDTGTNYWTRYITCNAGAVVLADVPNPADTMIQSGAPTANGRSVEMVITNPLAKSKVITVSTQFGNGNTTVSGQINLGGVGEWINTTAQITSMQMLTKAGNTMGAGSGFVVFGRNL